MPLPGVKRAFAHGRLWHDGCTVAPPMTGSGFSARAVLGVAVVALLACAHASTSAPVETVDAGADAAPAGNVLTGFGLLIVSELVTDGQDLYVAVSGGGQGEIER